MTEIIKSPINIRCPNCSKSGIIEFNTNLIKENQRGITAINIPEKIICKHSFIVYIDKNYTVRDSFCADFKIEIPKMKIELESTKVQSLGDINFYLLLINIHAICFARILRGSFLKKKILILNDLELIKKHLQKFIEVVFDKFLVVDIKLLSRNEYRQNKKQYKDYIILDGDKVSNDQNKILHEKSIKVEKIIIQKFLAETDTVQGLIILRNEIQKAFYLAQKIIKFNENLKEGQEYSSKRMLDHFYENNNLKISYDYLEFLTEIVNSYYDVELLISSTESDFFAF